MPDDGPKSALELAMERLRKKDKDEGVEAAPVTDAQRAAIAEARRVAEAKLAEREILYKSKMRGRGGAGGARDARGGVPPRPRAHHDDRDRKIEEIRGGALTAARSTVPSRSTPFLGTTTIPSRMK